MEEFARRKINFTAVKVNETSNKMIGVMTKSYNKISGGSGMVVNDLAKACATKSQAEVTKAFVASSSYILRAALGKGDKASAKKAAGGPALWDTKKFAVG